MTKQLSGQVVYESISWKQGSLSQYRQTSFQEPLGLDFENQVKTDFLLISYLFLMSEYYVHDQLIVAVLDRVTVTIETGSINDSTNITIFCS